MSHDTRTRGVATFGVAYITAYMAGDMSVDRFLAAIENEELLARAYTPSLFVGITRQRAKVFGIEVPFDRFATYYVVTCNRRTLDIKRTRFATREAADLFIQLLPELAGVKWRTHE